MPATRRVPFRWNPNAARYTNALGRFVARKEIRNALDAALHVEQQRMRTLANELRGGRISIGWWQRQMRSALKNTHIYSAAAARGGFAQMTQSDYGLVGLRLRQQYGYLDRFAAEIQGGLPLDGRFLSRVDLYAQSGRATYHEHDSKVQSELGMEFERSLLGDSDHCSACIEEEARGWVLIGELIPIGMRDCLGHCMCTMEYR